MTLGSIFEWILWFHTWRCNLSQTRTHTCTGLISNTYLELYGYPKIIYKIVDVSLCIHCIKNFEFLNFKLEGNKCFRMSVQFWPRTRTMWKTCYFGVVLVIICYSSNKNCSRHYVISILILLIPIRYLYVKLCLL